MSHISENINADEQHHIEQGVKLELSPRQLSAYEILQDKETNEVFYGGAA